MKLLEKRRSIIDDHISQQKIEETHWAKEAKSIRAEGSKRLPIAERPIAFICDDEIVVGGDCVGKVMDGLKKFVAMSKDHSHPIQKRRGAEAAVNNAIVKAEKLTSGEVPKELRVSQQTWNSINFCLAEVGIDCVLADGSDLD